MTLNFVVRTVDRPPSSGISSNIQNFNLGVKPTSPKGISPLHGAILVGFGVLCFYIGRADSLSEQLEQREKYNQRQRLRLGEQSQIQAC